MNAEEELNQAFANLKRRAGAVDVSTGPHLTSSPSPRRPLISALAFAALAAVAGISAWQLWPSDGGADSVNVAADGADVVGNDDGDDTGTTSEPNDDNQDDGSFDQNDSSDDGSDDDGRVDPAGEGARYRVDTDRVAADSADPFLNVRSSAGADNDLVAKLASTYRGLRATGEQTTADDGATWIEVELLHPAYYTGPEVDFNTFPTGWINGALAIPLADGIGVDSSEVAPCSGESAGDGLLGGLSGEAYIYGLESGYITDDCLRVVMTIAEGSAPEFWDGIEQGTGPADALPRISVSMESQRGGQGLVVHLGSIRAWPEATETSDGIYIARDYDGRLNLVAPRPVSSVTTTPLPELGVVVIDLAHNGTAPLSANRFVLTQQPLVKSGTVVINGLARPFEGTLGLSIVDADGQPVEATYSGSSVLGTIVTDEYGISTTDWTSAWGRFSIEAIGLEPGNYTLVFTDDTGSDKPTPKTIAVTITDGPIDEGPKVLDDTTRRAFSNLIGFAKGGSVDSVPLADEVTLAWGIGSEKTLSAVDLADRANWTFDEARGRVNILDVLGRRPVRMTEGVVPHCAGPPLPWPPERQALTQANVEPIGVDECLRWFAVRIHHRIVRAV